LGLGNLDVTVGDAAHLDSRQLVPHVLVCPLLSHYGIGRMGQRNSSRKLKKHPVPSRECMVRGVNFRVRSILFHREFRAECLERGVFGARAL
jgi:hypothetical protein